jgi:ArsR family transcriptional regulator, arsenate/arsenite/antimonite-responsive transcriptional repressor
MCMQVLDTTPVAEPDLAAHARLFHALSDERRLRILMEFGEGELCVCDLQAELGIAQSLLSFHLKALRDAGLVNVRRNGRWAHYSVNPEAMAHAAAAVIGLGQPSPPRATGSCCGG